MSSDLMTLIKRQSLLSIDELEKFVYNLSDQYGFVETKQLNIAGPKYLHYEDALDILKWHFIKEGFNGNSSSRKNRRKKSSPTS